MTQPYADPGTPMPLPVCPRHPDQVSYVRCQRCANPTCPQCQRPAAVGIQCVSCVAEAAKTHPTARTVLGGRRAGDARPVVTTSLIGVCAALYVLQTASGSGWLFQKFSLLPILGWSEPWRFITSAFLHGGLMHIVFNMFALWLLGGYLEPMLGRLRFVLLYLVSALGGGVAYVLLTPLTSRVGAVGASGAVFGLFGAVIILNKALRRDTAGIWVNLAINAVLPFVYPNIAWQAHVGGFLTGMALAFVYARARRNQTLAYGGTAAITLAIGALGAARYLVG